MLEGRQTPPKRYEQLRAQLQEMLPSLAPGQRRVAMQVLDDPEGVAFRSIGESAAIAHVHGSSLVRFAKRLGLAGYPELVQLCRDWLASEARLVGRLDRARAYGEAEDLFAALLADDTHNLERTFGRIDRDTWAEIARTLAHAPTVYVLGLRKCYTIAYLLAYLLRLIRPRVRQLGTTPGLLVDELRDLTTRDVLVLISIRRYSNDSVRALEYARAAGIATIALTDDPSSPLARAADRVIYVETGSVTILRSLTAFTSVAQALATSIALELGTASRDQLAIDQQMMTDFGIYANPEERN